LNILHIREVRGHHSAEETVMKVRVAYTAHFTDRERDIIGQEYCEGRRATREDLKALLEDLGTMGLDEVVGCHIGTSKETK
jgi:hypothetical protein